jgi:hypothetical protein
VDLGDGSDEKHLHICMTSRKLMSNIESKGVHHIDGTYRITIYGFPLIVYGVSDQCGVFHPIAYMITSHEKEEDFEHFYKGLIECAESLDLEYDPEFIMQDAQAASRSAVLKLFPNVNILMCYFHVKKNVKENCRHLMEKNEYDKLQEDLHQIHMSTSAEEYKENKKKFKKKYETQHKGVYDYCLTWFEGNWSNWQIFRNKPGQANTNSNIESFNNVIKVDLSRKRLPMKASINAIFEQIVYYSTEYSEFATIPKYNQTTKELADCLKAKNFKKFKNNRVIYEGVYEGKKSKYTLTFKDDQFVNNCSCECRYFLKHAVCMHLVAFCNLNNMELFGSRYNKPIKNDNFVFKEKRGRRKYGKALNKN